MNVKSAFLVLLALPVLATGCASIVDGGRKSVKIDSNPEGAKVTIVNRAGKEICTRTTPATVSLNRSAGFFEGEAYTLKLQKEGFYPYEAHVQSTLDGWYFGNVVLGGWIGLLVVDPATGAMFTLSPRQVNCNLVPIQTSAADGAAREQASSTGHFSR